MNLLRRILALAAVNNASSSSYDQNYDHDYGCSPNKLVTLHRFCIDGQSSLEEYTSHGYFLNSFLSGDTAAIDRYQTGECNEIGNDPRIVRPDEPLEVGIHGYGDFHEEEVYSYTLSSDWWYNDSCGSYDVVLSGKNTGNNDWYGCWEPSGAGTTGADDAAAQHPAPPPPTGGMELERCTEGWEYSADTFAWYLRVEPISVWPETDAPFAAPSTTTDPAFNLKVAAPSNKRSFDYDSPLYKSNYAPTPWYKRISTATFFSVGIALSALLRCLFPKTCNPYAHTEADTEADHRSDRLSSAV